MKWLIVVLLAMSAFFLGWVGCGQWKSAQGFVQSDDGQEWKLTRMQTLGMGQDFVGVYQRTK